MTTDTFTKDEAYILYQGLIALDRSSTSDEPHTAHTQEFRDLLKKVKELRGEIKF